jgi:hypothetical protein
MLSGYTMDIPIVCMRTILVTMGISNIQHDITRLPVSVRRSASLAKCAALLKGNGSQVNEL